MDGAGRGAGVRAGPDDGLLVDENEWKEFQQEEIDYRGLRVQAVQISEKEEGDSEKREDPCYNWEDGGREKILRSLE